MKEAACRVGVRGALYTYARMASYHPGAANGIAHHRRSAPLLPPSRPAPSLKGSLRSSTASPPAPQAMTGTSSRLAHPGQYRRAEPNLGSPPTAHAPPRPAAWRRAATAALWVSGRSRRREATPRCLGQRLRSSLHPRKSPPSSQLGFVSPADALSLLLGPFPLRRRRHLGCLRRCRRCCPRRRAVPRRSSCTNGSSHYLQTYTRGTPIRLPPPPSPPREVSAAAVAAAAAPSRHRLHRLYRRPPLPRRRHRTAAAQHCSQRCKPRRPTDHRRHHRRRLRLPPPV